MKNRFWKSTHDKLTEVRQEAATIRQGGGDGAYFEGMADGIRFCRDMAERHSVAPDFIAYLTRMIKLHEEGMITSCFKTYTFHNLKKVALEYALKNFLEMIAEEKQDEAEEYPFND